LIRIEFVKPGVVALSERPATGNQFTARTVADGLELPDSANQFEVAHVQALRILHPAQACLLRRQ